MIAELHTAISNAPRRKPVDPALTSADRVKIRVARMTHLLRGAPIAIAVSIVNAMIAVAVAWPLANRTVLLGWAGAVIAVNLLRFAFWLSATQFSSSVHRLTTFSRLHFAGMAINGALWGALAPIFAAYGLLTSAFLPFMIAGMTAAAIVSASSSWRAVLAFNIPALLPFAVVYAVAGGPQGPAIAALVFLYAVATGYLAWRMQEVVLRAIRLRSRNDRLLDVLKKQIDAAHEAEQRYRALVEASRDLTIIFSPEGRVTYASPSIDTNLGLSARSMVGMTTKDIIHAEDIGFFRSVGGKALAAIGEAAPLPQVRLRSGDGSYAAFSGRLTNMLYVPGVDGFVFSGARQEARPRARIQAAE